MATLDRRRPGAWWLCPLAAAVGLALLAGLVVGCSGNAGGEASSTAQLPTAADPPAATAEAFLSAWSRDDRTTMRELSTEAFWRSFSETLGGSTTFSDVTITLTTPRPEGDRSRSEDVKAYAEVVYVLVDAMIRQRPVATWTDGRHPWGFEVVRNSAEERWLVGSAGLG